MNINKGVLPYRQLRKVAILDDMSVQRVLPYRQPKNDK